MVSFITTITSPILRGILLFLYLCLFLSMYEYPQTRESSTALLLQHSTQWNHRKCYTVGACLHCVICGQECGTFHRQDCWPHHQLAFWYHCPQWWGLLCLSCSNHGEKDSYKIGNACGNDWYCIAVEPLYPNPLNCDTWMLKAPEMRPPTLQGCPE